MARRGRYRGIFNKEHFVRAELGPTYERIEEARAACAPLEEEHMAVGIAKAGLCVCARDLLGEGSPFVPTPMEECHRHDGYKQFLGLIQRGVWIRTVLVPCHGILATQQLSCMPFGQEYQAIAAAMTGLHVCARALVGDETPFKAGRAHSTGS